jgi:lysophospholipase L1-like esterase
MLKKTLIGLAVLLLALLAGAGYLLSRIDNPGFWEFQIEAYEQADRKDPPAQGQILFVGSSSIRLWETLEDDMVPLPVLNRGFGGAHLDHVNLYAPRIVLPYAPAAIVLYAGDNDLGRSTGKTAETVLEDFGRFVSIVRAELPKTRIYFVSIKPSRWRRAQWPEQNRANQMIAEQTRRDPLLSYIDVAGAMFAADGKLREDLFVFDGLHLNATGYALWTSIIRPILERDFGHLTESAVVPFSESGRGHRERWKTALPFP